MYDSELPCPHCNGIGKGEEFARAGECKNWNDYCACCVSRGIVEKREWKAEWVLVSNSDDLIQVWLDHMAKVHFDSYDHFVEPAEYPCLVHIHKEQIADGGGSVMDFFYPGDVPDAWKSG